MSHTIQFEKSTRDNRLGSSKTRSPAQRSDINVVGVQKVDLVQEVVNRLRDQIISEQFEPSGLMPAEGELGETFSVSRTVIREAMRMLCAQGLVEVSQGRVPRVRSADPQHVVESFGTFLQRGDHSLLDLLEVRRPLETEIAALAAQRVTPPQINEMEETIKQQANASTLEEQIDADMHFHDLLAKAAANPIFGLLLTTLAGLMYKSRQETITYLGSKRALDGHRAVLAAIRRADVRAARKAMLDHLAMAEEDLRGEKV
jgi:GntR family transcriptional repressor for pyruvate dehydrogenase complex